MLESVNMLTHIFAEKRELVPSSFPQLRLVNRRTLSIRSYSIVSTALESFFGRPEKVNIKKQLLGRKKAERLESMHV
jgi:hypothetical protein